MLKRKGPAEEILQREVPLTVLGERLFNLKQEAELIEKESTKIKNEIKLRIPAGDSFFFNTSDGPKQIRHQKTETPVITDMKKVKRKVGEQNFCKVVRVDMVSLRKFLGEEIIKDLADEIRVRKSVV